MDAVERAFGVQVGESYGLTEGGPVMLGPPLDGRPVPRGSCGAAWPEGEIKLVRDGAEDPRYGELWVRNPGVTTGYHNLPDVNADRIRDGWLATGDLFLRDDDGFYHFRGRTDDMFNSGGENIYPRRSRICCCRTRMCLMRRSCGAARGEGRGAGGDGEAGVGIGADGGCAEDVHAGARARVRAPAADRAG